MTLIILLMVLVAERVALQSQMWQASHYLNAYFPKAIDKLSPAQDAPWAMFAIVAGPAVVVLVILQLLNSSLVDFLVGLFVMAIAIGNSEVRKLYRQYLNALDREDEEAKSIIQCQLTDTCQGLETELQPSAEDVTHDQQIEQAKALAAERESIGETLIWINFRYYAAPIFYFVLFSVPGVVFFTTLLYLCQFSNKTTLLSPANQHRVFTWLEWLCWLPSRFVSLGFMIVGNFSNGLETWLKYAVDFSKSAREMLCQVAFKSEQYGEHQSKENAQHMVKLTKRNMVLFLVVVALLTLYGRII